HAKDEVGLRMDVGYFVEVFLAYCRPAVWCIRRGFRWKTDSPDILARHEVCDGKQLLVRVEQEATVRPPQGDPAGGHPDKFSHSESDPDEIGGKSGDRPRILAYR